jgi:hypothetical protein
MDKEVNDMCHMLGVVLSDDLEFLGRVSRLHQDLSDDLKPGLKKTMIVYNILKKTWDTEQTTDNLIRLVKLFLQTNRRDLIFICVTGTLSVSLPDSMENLEASDYTSGDYVIVSNHLKYMYDLRKEVGLSEPL